MADHKEHRDALDIRSAKLSEMFCGICSILFSHREMLYDHREQPVRVEAEQRQPH